MRRRIVFKKINNGPITNESPSYKRYLYTNQVFDEETNEWKFINRYIGKFGANSVVWYTSIEKSEEFAPQDAVMEEMIEDIKIL